MAGNGGPNLPLPSPPHGSSRVLRTVAHCSLGMCTVFVDFLPLARQRKREGEGVLGKAQNRHGTIPIVPKSARCNCLGDGLGGSPRG